MLFVAKSSTKATAQLWLPRISADCELLCNKILLDCDIRVYTCSYAFRVWVQVGWESCECRCILFPVQCTGLGACSVLREETGFCTQVNARRRHIITLAECATCPAKVCASVCVCVCVCVLTTMTTTYIVGACLCMCACIKIAHTFATYI